MKIRLLLALVGLATSFALPTFAQQTNTQDPQLRQELLALAKKFEEAWDNNVFLTGEGRSAYRILVHRPDFLKSFENFPWS
jgi:hypothetical protein